MLVSCASVDLRDYQATREARTYFGVVRVNHSPLKDKAEARISHIDITTVGIRVDSGVSLGYLQESLLFVPLDCRLVVFVRNEQQLLHAKKMLESIAKERLCVASNSEE